MENSELTIPKRRSQAEKVGKHKYELQRMARIDARLERIEQMQRILFQGLSWYFHFERPFIEKVCCESDMDFAVVSAIYESGSGVLAKKIASDLKSFKLEKHKILRIVNRVNRKCHDVFGKLLIEKQGKKWVFTEFGFEIWGKTREEVELMGKQPRRCRECGRPISRGNKSGYCRTCFGRIVLHSVGTAAKPTATKIDSFRGNAR